MKRSSIVAVLSFAREVGERETDYFSIEGKLEKGIITITIINPVPEYRHPTERASNKMAQENIKQRLSALYGMQGRLQVNQTGTQYELTIRFPYTQER